MPAIDYLALSSSITSTSTGSSDFSYNASKTIVFSFFLNLLFLRNESWTQNFNTILNCTHNALNISGMITSTIISSNSG